MTVHPTFTDREKQIEAFQQLVKMEDGQGWILAITGFSGLGKTWLLDTFEELCRQESGWLHVRVDPANKEGDVEQLYRQILRKLQTGLKPAAWQTFKARCRAANERLLEAKAVLQASQSAEESQHVSQSLTIEAGGLLREQQKVANQEKAGAFLEALEGCRAAARVLVLIENYDLFQNREAVESCGLFWSTLEETRVDVPGLRVVLASREPVLHRNSIQTLEQGLMEADCGELEAFERKFSDRLLQSLGVTDEAYQQLVYERLAKGHPLMTQLAGVVWVKTPGGIAAGEVPALMEDKAVMEWLLERIWRQLEDPLKTLIQGAAMMRWFNAEALAAGLGMEAEVVQAHFRELTRRADFRMVDGGWQCHNLERQAAVIYLRRERPEWFADFHRRAAACFAGEANPRQIYHTLCADPASGMELWAQAVKTARASYDTASWWQLIELARSPEIVLPAANQAVITEEEAGYYLWLSANEKAEEHYRAALKVYQEIGDRRGQANCMKGLGDAARMQDDYPAAEAHYRAALKVYQEIGNRLGQANCIYRLGEICFEGQAYSEAGQHFLEAAQRYEQLNLRQWAAVSWNWRGSTLTAMRADQQAVEAFTRAIEQNRQEAMFWRNRASASIRLRQFGGAAADLDEAGRLDPDSAYLFVRRGELALMMGEAEQALRDFDEALKRESDLCEAAFGMGEARALLRQGEEAAAAFTAGLEMTYKAYDLDNELIFLDLLKQEHAQAAVILEELAAMLRAAKENRKRG